MAKQPNKVEKMLDKKLGAGLGMFEKDTPMKKLVRTHAQMIVGARSAPDSWQKNIMRGAIARAGKAKRAARAAGIKEQILKEISHDMLHRYITAAKDQIVPVATGMGAMLRQIELQQKYPELDDAMRADREMESMNSPAALRGDRDWRDKTHEFNSRRQNAALERWRRVVTKRLAGIEQASRIMVNRARNRGISESRKSIIKKFLDKRKMNGGLEAY